ncbi:hypothetical protein [Streptomyces sp. 3211]|uniref:hypothetical protein n=1 Tax=Streptomyces sp. 3211 TaxID=1964449 RepID=UPI0009A4940C|nr:hypothetical protein [Streptomyces sp. 3211]
MSTELQSVARARRFVFRSSTPAGPPQLDYPPVRNGVDYLLSVVEYLTEETETATGVRALKYAVLHLQAAVEVLLKYRLIQEHWSLVFAKPETATRSAFDKAEFNSCTTDQAVQRLERIACVAFTEKDKEALTALTKDRNALQHYGLTHTAEAVESRAVSVLDFLVRFLDSELMPRLSGDDRDAIRLDMGTVRSGLNQIDSFVTQRMNLLRGNELKGQKDRILQCLECLQDALVIGPARAICHFCSDQHEGTEAVLNFVLGSGSSEWAEKCPHCDARALIQDVQDHLPLPDTLAGFCFACATGFTDLTPCDRCMNPIVPEADDGTASAPQTLCPDCVGHAHYPDEHVDKGDNE